MKNTLQHFHYLVEKNYQEMIGIFSSFYLEKNIVYVSNTQLYLMAILKTLGFHIASIRFPHIKKTTKKNDDYYNYLLEPSIDFYIDGKPMEKYKNEFRIIKKELQKSNYDSIHPYLNWATDEGEKIRDDIDKIFKKTEITQEYREWLKKHKKITKKFTAFVDSFQKKNTSFHFYFNEKNNTFTIEAKKKKKSVPRHSLNKEEKLNIAQQYEKELQKLVDAIYEYYG